jgi:hypothetical protein
MNYFCNALQTGLHGRNKSISVDTTSIRMKIAITSLDRSKDLWFKLMITLVEEGEFSGWFLTLETNRYHRFRYSAGC